MGDRESQRVVGKQLGCGSGPPPDNPSCLFPSHVLHAGNWDGRRQDLAECFPRSEDLGFSVVNTLMYFVVVDPGGGFTRARQVFCH